VKSNQERAADLVSRMTLAEKVSQMVHDAPAIERLGIPAYNWWNECLHGVARAGAATVFPQAIGLAATWNPDLVHRIAVATSDEARAKHHQALRRNIRQIYSGLTQWSPNVNIFRDPRWAGVRRPMARTRVSRPAWVWPLSRACRAMIRTI